MKGDRKRRKSHFPKGKDQKQRRPPAPKRELRVQYIRPTAEEQNLLGNSPIKAKSLPQTAAKDQSATRKVFLRSQCHESITSSVHAKGNINVTSSTSYKLVHTQKMWDMMNTVTKEHFAANPRCTGNLQFDEDSEVQWGLVWRERAICDKCRYRSALFNLYEEIETGRRGRRSATANVGFNIAVTQTPAAATSVIKMLLGGNIPAPSTSGMYKCASKVSEIIKEANIADMKVRRQQLKRLNTWQDKPENIISVQCDGTYNNNLYSGVGQTPFQPATQCTYVVAENMTDKKQIIAMETVNKLCPKHGFHTAADDPCDIKSGNCPATASMETNIGDEESWAKMCFQDLKSDDLELNYITTDPDTKAYKAAEDLFNRKITTTQPRHQIDTRHLSQNHRKQIKSNTAVLSMMPGQTRTYRLYLRNRFALDISKRCQAEFDSVHQAVDGDFTELVNNIHQCILAVKQCYCGDHTFCRRFSRVCKGENEDNWIKRSCFIPRNFTIDASKEESQRTLLECIEYRLSDDMLELTRLNTNSQKVEAFNRSLKRSLPKNVTFSRNYAGRAHSAVHSVNNGPGTSIRKLCDAARCPIPAGSKVERSLMGLDVAAERQKARDKSTCSKQKRKMRRNKLFKLYETHQEEKKYVKGQLLRRMRANTRATTVRMRRQAQAAREANPDHDYQRNPRANQLVKQKRQAGKCPPTQNPADLQ